MREEQIAAIREVVSEILQMASQSMDHLSDEVKEQLADLLEMAANRLVELQQAPPEEPTVIGLPPPEIPPQVPSSPLESSNIYGFNYDPETQQLKVKFNGKDQRDDGPVYNYQGVPEIIYDVFRRGAVPAKTTGQNRWGRWWRGKVPSMGAAMFALIKNGGYPYQRVA